MRPSRRGTRGCGRRGRAGSRRGGLGGLARGREDGQLTVFLVGLVLLILMALALGWDTSNWLIGRRVMNDLADGAAVSAAGSVDVDRFSRSGGRDLALSEAGAARTVRALVAESGIEGVSARVTVGTGPGGRPAVTVRLSAPARTRFLHLLGLTAPVMSAEAEAVAFRVGPSGG